VNYSIVRSIINQACYRSSLLAVTCLYMHNIFISKTYSAWGWYLMIKHIKCSWKYVLKYGDGDNNTADHSPPINAEYVEFYSLFLMRPRDEVLWNSRSSVSSLPRIVTFCQMWSRKTYCYSSGSSVVCRWARGCPWLKLQPAARIPPQPNRTQTPTHGTLRTILPMW